MSESSASNVVNLSELQQSVGEPLPVRTHILQCYHRTKDAWRPASIAYKGHALQNSGTYGSGIYTSHSLLSQMRQRMINSYGKYIVRYQVNVYGFLILDRQLAEHVYGAPLTIEEQYLKFQKVIPPTVKFGPKKELVSIRDISNVCAVHGQRLFDITTDNRGTDVDDTMHPAKPQFSSVYAKLLHTNFQLTQTWPGVIYVGAQDGPVTLIYDRTQATPDAWFRAERFKKERGKASVESELHYFNPTWVKTINGNGGNFYHWLITECCKPDPEIDLVAVIQQIDRLQLHHLVEEIKKYQSVNYEKARLFERLLVAAVPQQLLCNWKLDTRGLWALVFKQIGHNDPTLIWTKIKEVPASQNIVPDVEAEEEDEEDEEDGGSDDDDLPDDKALTLDRWPLTTDIVGSLGKERLVQRYIADELVDRISALQAVRLVEISTKAMDRYYEAFLKFEPNSMSSKGEMLYKRLEHCRTDLVDLCGQFAYDEPASSGFQMEVYQAEKKINEALRNLLTRLEEIPEIVAWQTHLRESVIKFDVTQEGKTLVSELPGTSASAPTLGVIITQERDGVTWKNSVSCRVRIDTRAKLITIYDTDDGIINEALAPKPTKNMSSGRGRKI